MNVRGERRPVVIGVGNAWRTDDGIGPAAIDALRRAGAGTGADLAVLDGEPTRLVDAWRGRSLAVAIDATVTGAAPGTIHRAEVGVDALPGCSAQASSHSGGLAEAIALSQVLDGAPRRLIVFGVEPASVEHGSSLSAAVADALPALVERVLAEIASADAGDRPC